MGVAILDSPVFIMRKLEYFKNIKLSQIGYNFVSKLCKQGQQNTILQVKFFHPASIFYAFYWYQFTLTNNN